MLTPNLLHLKEMQPDPALLFPNPPLESLSTTFGQVSLQHGLALKFPRQITPFAALLKNSAAALSDLHSLLEPGESTYIVSFEAPPTIPGITTSRPYPVRQFEWPATAPIPPISDSLTIEPLTCAHAQEMVNLTDIAFPGFFRIRTCEMGPYFGIRSSRGAGNSARGTGNNAGRLVAVCGERMNIRRAEDTFREISGLCTHPEFRGRGYAPALLAHMLQLHRAAGLRSYLHVASSNPTAIALYERLGFIPRGEFPLYSVRRPA
ncbi:MAG TPA: GNAT family N-acetyltransferase [Acidobacteriaceae bacterium]|nr:GNAT family N-acetyltransferase [Acidobacteriaceae bacterium]